MVQADLGFSWLMWTASYWNSNSDPTAKRLEKIELSIVDYWYGCIVLQRTGGMLTKIKAATIATESGARVYLLHEIWYLDWGTLDGSSSLRQEKGLLYQKQWLAFYAQSQERLSMVELQRHFKNGKVPFIGCGRSGMKLLLPRYCNSSRQRTGQSLERDVQFKVSALEDMLRSC